MNAQELQTKGFCVVRGVVTEDACFDAVETLWKFYMDISNGVVSSLDSKSWNNQTIYPKGGLFENFGAGWMLGSLREVLADKLFQEFYSTKELHCSKEGFRIVCMPPNATTCFQASNEGDESILIRSLTILSSKVKIRAGTETFFLSRGDVLLFRSNIPIEEVYTTEENNITDYHNAPVAMYCTMTPAIDISKTKSVLNRKIDAYKQRQTGTFRVNDETWTRPSDAPCRCYFRTHPPIVTRRQAELYGLIPYHSNHWEEEFNSALIRGVCFSDYCGEYQSLSRDVERECKALSTQLTSTDPHVLHGQDKYLGGMASPCGKYIYGVPGTSRRVLRISTETGVMDCIGPSFNGKFKWLRGVEVPPAVMSDTEYPDGCCIALPCNSLSFLKVNPASTAKRSVYTFGQKVLEELCKDVNGWYYHGGNLASNGWIYCIPANATRVIKLNPVSDEVVVIGPTLEGFQKFYGGIIGSDGCIYGIPHNAQGVLKIDPLTDKVTTLEGTNEPLPFGDWKWHGGLASGDKIIGFPNNSDQILVINCKESTVYTIGDSSILKSGRHRIPQDGRYKYLGGALTSDGRYAYLFPCDAERVLRIDCQTDKMALVGPCLLDGINKFQNGFSGRDGCLYGIPQRAVGVLRITPARGDETEDHVDVIPCGEEMMGVKDKFEGGVLGHDGSIYCIPLTAKTCTKIIPERL